MSRFGGTLRRKAETEQDFELNIASIIDCFTVLITYLLVSASFISIGVLDVSSVSGAQSPEVKVPPLTLSVQMDQAKIRFLKVTGGDAAKQLVSVPAKQGAWDFEG